MSQEPPLIPPAPPKKRRLGCLAWFGLGALFCALLLAGLHRYGRHQRARELIERATTALMADDAASALDSLYTAHLENPDDARIAALYETVQQKWLESIDRQLATRTPAQRYLLLNEDPVHRDSRQLAEPRATAFRQFVERSAEDTRRQIDETVARAMDLVENGRFSDGWNEMETLRVCYRYPGLNDLRANFDTFYTARLLIHAGDLGQNGQTESAHRLLDQLTKDHRLAPGVQRAVLFRIDLGDYLLHANQAVLAASQGDEKTARARLEEAKVLFARLVNNPELMVFFADLPPRDRGSALIDPFNTAEAAVRILAAKTPKR